MQNKIKLLENNLINKIAAGEVVERPASIVKELVENSIDANAKNITVDIKNGGKTYIKIADDGLGIHKDDIKTAFVRHATSKISKLDELDDILTLGFRGEALASIASISKLTMSTKTKNDDIGNSIDIHGGKVISEKEVAMLNGSTFVIKNVFFNTPARNKFLKKDSVEGGYITDIITKLALSHCNISFKYINNGTEIFKTSGDNNLKNTIFSIYGKEICKKMIQINTQKNGFSLKGYISLPELSRSNRSYETFFINGRYIKSPFISSAIKDGYNDRLMIGKFPIFVLELTTPSRCVDVNVHPTKLEVRFADEPFIHNFLSSSIDNVLKEKVLIPSAFSKEDNEDIDKDIDKDVKKVSTLNKDTRDKLISSLLAEDESPGLAPPSKNSPFLTVNEGDVGASDSAYSILKDMPILVEEDIPIENEYYKYKDKYTKQNTIPNLNIQKKDDILNKKVKIEQVSIKENNNLFFNNYKIIGQIFNTYWIIEQKNELFLIDQHSAHEKVIYEELKKSFSNGNVVSQPLLNPTIINLSPIEKITFLENRELLSSLGFDIEDFGDSSYAIRLVPFVFKAPVEPSFFIDILGILIDKKIENIYEARAEAVISMSCKKAVKANDKLNFIEAKALIEKLLKLENPFNCPHGRPTIVKMNKYDIEKMFKRIQN